MTKHNKLICSCAHICTTLRASANSLNFQLYLLEGLNRWNQDREAASLAVKPPSQLSYLGDLVHCVNTHSVKVLGRKLVPSFQPPAVYTG